MQQMIDFAVFISITKELSFMFYATNDWFCSIYHNILSAWLTQ
jgi:hypothetical protein